MTSSTWCLTSVRICSPLLTNLLRLPVIKFLAKTTCSVITIGMEIHTGRGSIPDSSVVTVFYPMSILFLSRSPWSNTYDPPLDDGTMPSEKLRKLEIEANAAFVKYREMYFEGGVSSVYLWDLEHGFAGTSS